MRIIQVYEFKVWKGYISEVCLICNAYNKQVKNYKEKISLISFIFLYKVEMHSDDQDKVKYVHRKNLFKKQVTKSSMILNT